MKSKFPYFFLLLSIISCRTTEENSEISLEKKCFITKFDKKTITTTGQQIYNSELVYNGDKVIAWKDFSWIESGSQFPPIYQPQIKSVINVEYNNNLPSKIIEPKSYNGYQYIDYLTYDSNGRIINKERVLTVNDLYESKNVFTYSYNSDNQIVSVENKHYDYQNVLDNEQNEIWVYQNSNLITRTINNTYTPGHTVQTIITYGDYDSFKNPYLNVNVPFEQFLPLKFSKNNYRSYSSKIFVDNALQSHVTENISSFSYNENGYPTNKVDYLCN